MTAVRFASDPSQQPLPQPPSASTSPAASPATATSPDSNSSRSTGRAHSRRKPPPSISTTSRISGLLTPAGSADNSGTESPDEEVHDHEEGMRHGFAEEYNSEAYLAVLEQV